MALTVREALSAWARPALQLWDRIPVRVQGRITIGLPLVAVFISACLAITGNSQRISIETDIQRKFEMSAALDELTSLMVNAETGTRGYLLTGQVEFLQPFVQASRQLSPALDTLRGLASAESEEGPRGDKMERLQELQTLTAQQMADLSYQRNTVAAGQNDASSPEIRQHLAYGKELTDKIRSEVNILQGEEQELLNSRIAEIDAIRTRDYVSVAVALIAAVATRFVAWFLFRRGVLRRVELLTGNLRDRRYGSSSALPPPTKKDQMGELEREVHLLGRDPHQPGAMTPAPSCPPGTPGLDTSPEVDQVGREDHSQVW